MDSELRWMVHWWRGAGLPSKGEGSAVKLGRPLRATLESIQRIVYVHSSPLTATVAT